MTTKTSLWDVFSEEKRTSYINDIIAYFLDDLDEEIGVIAAGQILDAIVEPIAIDAYNRGVQDAKVLAQHSFEDILTDMDVLEKQ